MNCRRSFPLLLALSLLVGCQDVDGTTKASVFHEGVGAQISLDVATRWARRSEDVGSRDVSAAQLAVLVDASPDRVGVVFHEAMDDEGARHLLLTTMGEDAEPWASIVIDVDAAATVNVDTARAWTARHAAVSDDGPRYHFYGRDMLDEIIANPRFDHLGVSRALDDEGQGQLVLMAWNDDGDARSGQPTPYDTGLTCPPVCSVD
jgi:hypothetical protein